MSLPKQWSEQFIDYEKLVFLGKQCIHRDDCDHHAMARRLLCIACQIDKVFLIKNSKEIVSAYNINAYYNAIQRFNKFEPLSKIEGIGHFYGLDLEISADTLDPRPETELLIDLLLETYIDTNMPLQILDIGTGSGCLAISAAKKYPLSQVTALDISDKALIIAQRNAKKFEVKDRIRFLHANQNLTNIDFDDYNVILCNPPYIPEQAQTYLDASVIHYDPEVALFSGDNGLEFYTILANVARQTLKKTGCVIVEFGIGQAKCVKEIFSNNNLHNFKALKDYHNIIRAAKIQF